MTNRFYVSTSIPYVNARPHIGFALEAVLSDALARWHRLAGFDVRFTSGTDDNSLSNVRAAEAERISVRDLVDRNARHFWALKEGLDLSYDSFVRTSSNQEHSFVVKALWSACDGAGDIYLRPYRGSYCVGCERFYSEDEAVEGRCPFHGSHLEVVEEKNYFFRLSKYNDAIRDLISSERLRLLPATKAQEILQLCDRGLEDFSVSRTAERSRGWGIPVPGDSSQTVYVWFDALANYITALGYGTEDSLYRDYWDRGHVVHVIGKDIVRQHAVYWPAILLSAGLRVPDAIFVHCFLTVGGQRISKSAGTAIDPLELASIYGRDALRYYLLRHVHPTKDSDFNLDAFVSAHDTDLADQLGNLVSRVTALADRQFGEDVVSDWQYEREDHQLIDAVNSLQDRLEAARRDLSPQSALGSIWEVVRLANRYIVARQPWAQDEPSLVRTLTVLVEILRIVGESLRPFLPETARSVLNAVGFEPTSDAAWPSALSFGTPSFRRLARATPLFPKRVTGDLQDDCLRS